MKTADVKSKGWDKHPEDVASSCAIVLVNKDGEEYYQNGSSNKLYWSVSGTKKGWMFKTTNDFMNLDSTYDNKQFDKKLEELQKEIEQYTVIIEDLYRYCGVKECLVKYLRGSYDFVINECDAAYQNGLLTECCYNGDSSIIKQIKHGMPFLNKRVVQSFKYKLL